MSKMDSPLAGDATEPKVAKDAAERTIIENDHDIFLRGLLSIMVLVLKKLSYALPPYIQVYTKLETLRPAPEIRWI